MKVLMPPTLFPNSLLVLGVGEGFSLCKLKPIVRVRNSRVTGS